MLLYSLCSSYHPKSLFDCRILNIFSENYRMHRAKKKKQRKPMMFNRMMKKSKKSLKQKKNRKLRALGGQRVNWISRSQSQHHQIKMMKMKMMKRYIFSDTFHHLIDWLISNWFVLICVFPFLNCRANQAQLQKTVLENENHEKIKLILRL